MALDMNCEELGIGPLLLMESAAWSVVKVLSSKLDISQHSFLVVAYNSHKGGDGLAVARLLSAAGAKVAVLLACKPGDVTVLEARKNLEILLNLEYSAEVHYLRDSSELESHRRLFESVDVIIDALIGYGLKGKLREPVLSVVRAINSYKGKKLIVSIDVPTGVDVDEGILGECVKADLTVTFHAPKKSFAEESVKATLGELHVVDIGIPVEAELFVGKGDLATAVPVTSKYVRKGGRGKVLIIGGSKEFSGAPALSAMAALRCGVDLAVVLAPEVAANAIRSLKPDLIAIPLEGEHLCTRHLPKVLDEMKRFHAVVLGPGASIHDDLPEVCLEVAKAAVKLGKAVVVDADAIKALASVKQELPKSKSIVLTPHDKEFEMFFEVTIPKEGSKAWVERSKVVQAKAKEQGVVVVLKGRYDVISDGERVKVNRRGSPAMAVGGTGDVLSGAIAAFCCWNQDVFRAAAAAAYLCGLAGELAAEDKGLHILASDLLEYIPKVLKEHDKVA